MRRNHAPETTAVPAGATVRKHAGLGQTLGAGEFRRARAHRFAATLTPELPDFASRRAPARLTAPSRTRRGDQRMLPESARPHADPVSGGRPVEWRRDTLDVRNDVRDDVRYHDEPGVIGRAMPVVAASFAARVRTRVSGGT